MMVVIVGIDGSGKTTVIHELQKKLVSSFIHLKYFHLHFKVRAEVNHESTAVDPHAKPPYPLPVSIAKVFYLLLIYHIGYWINIKDVRAQESLLLFDRYYYDLIVDPRRFRYEGPLWITQMIGKIMPKPDLVIFLDAPSEVLLSRKQELSKEEIERQRQAYKEVVQSLPNGHILNATQSLGAVVKDAEHIIVAYAKQRLKQCLENY